MNYYKKSDILELMDHELISAFERTVIDMTKCENFTKRGTSPRLRKQYEWIREELSQRMRR